MAELWSYMESVLLEEFGAARGRGGYFVKVQIARNSRRWGKESFSEVVWLKESQLRE